MLKYKDMKAEEIQQIRRTIAMMTSMINCSEQFTDSVYAEVKQSMESLSKLSQPPIDAEEFLKSKGFEGVDWESSNWDYLLQGELANLLDEYAQSKLSQDGWVRVEDLSDKLQEILPDIKLLNFGGNTLVDFLSQGCHTIQQGVDEIENISEEVYNQLSHLHSVPPKGE